MSKNEAMRLAEEYVDKQIAAMPKQKGQATIKLTTRDREALVKSAARIVIGFGRR